MKFLHVTMVVLAATLGGTALARPPVPFPGQPEPDLSKRRQCTNSYLRSVERQVAAMEQLRTAGPEAMGRLCTVIEIGGAWLDDELRDEARRRLREALGLGLDFERIAAQCRIGQDNLERELITRLGYLRSELVRCKDTI